MSDAYDAIDPKVLAELKACDSLLQLRDVVRAAYYAADASPDLGERAFWAGLAIAYGLGMMSGLREIESVLPKESN